MKIKGLRWWIIGLIMIITIINYLDRGTLNYMWVANIEYELVDNIQPDLKENQAKTKTPPPAPAAEGLKSQGKTKNL